MTRKKEKVSGIRVKKECARPASLRVLKAVPAIWQSNAEARQRSEELLAIGNSDNLKQKASLKLFGG